MSYLVVSIAAESIEQAVQQARSAVQAGAQLLELRLDYFDQLSTDGARAAISAVRSGLCRPVGLIVTCRDFRQGGARNHPLSDRLEALIAAVEASVEYVDLEYENFAVPETRQKIEQALYRRPKTHLILSAHDFHGRFADIDKLYRDIVAICPEAIPKLVYTANHINDCFEAFDLLHNSDGNRIVLCMGPAGVITRILAAKLGGFVTFAAAEPTQATAPGQLTIDELKGLYRYDIIGSQTELFGVIADPVGHSLSPVIHNACFARFGMNKLYLPLWVQGGQAEFDAFMENVLTRPWLGFRGFSVTIPHKHNALMFVKASGGTVEPLAEKIGAVNTLLIGADGAVQAYNTDYAGALKAITDALGGSALKGLPVAVIGAGGVARAIVAGLSDAGAKVTIYNRTVEKAERLAAEFGCRALPLDALAQLDAKLVVNCTSLGMHPSIQTTPLAEHCIRADMVVFDTVYNPARTLLLKQAASRGARTIDGVSMFVNQALAQFELFTGKPGDGELMRQTVEAQLAAAQDN